MGGLIVLQFTGVAAATGFWDDPSKRFFLGIILALLVTIPLGYVIERFFSTEELKMMILAMFFVGIVYMIVAGMAP